MRLLPFIPLPALLLLLALPAQTAHSAEAAEPSWPLWDGQESVEQYAKRTNLEPTRTLDLGNGVKLEMVLIPAGKFTMGTPEPPPVDEEGFVTRIWIGQFAVAASVGVLLVFVAVVIVRAVRRRHRPQYSLARFVVIIVVIGVGVLGGTHWRESARTLDDAKTQYRTALVRYEDASDWEKPAHEVTLTRPFYLGKYEVTQEQYEQVMATNPSSFEGPDLPVEQASWDEAQEFCKKASVKTGLTVKLPSEAQWEYACRAGTKTAYYTGDTDADLDRAGWYDKNSDSAPHPVRQKTPNAWGLYDMHGNVWEWCGNWYAPYKAEAAVDPQGPREDQFRVLRGGCWGASLGRCRSTALGREYPEFRFNYLGFRAVADVSPKAP